MESLKLVKNINEISHDIRENTDTEQKYKCSNKSFNVAAWYIVSEADCWEGCKREVNWYNKVLLSCVLHDTFGSQESFRVVVCINWRSVLEFWSCVDIQDEVTDRFT